MLEKNTKIVHDIAYELGFQFCGISKAEFLESEALRLESWLNENRNGKMDYMANHFDKRLDPTLLVEGSKSVISLLYNYYPEKNQIADTYKISKYAFGKDYHDVIRDKMKLFLQLMNERIGEIGGRVFVDSAPIMDKVWAKKSGLGWIGKNTNLINPKKGSFYFISELIVDLELIPDGPIKDYCGRCTRCIDACPTGALDEPYKIDASKCISYLTIELKDELIDPKFQNQMQDWIYGCDICQDVCPWNRFSMFHDESQFNGDSRILNFTKQDWENLDEETFKEIFKGSAVKRTKYNGLTRNINYVKS